MAKRKSGKIMAELADNGLVIILDPYLWMVSYGMVAAFAVFFTAVICRKHYREQEKIEK